MRHRSRILIALLTVLGSTASARAEPTPACASSRATPVRTIPAPLVAEDRSLGYVCVEPTDAAIGPASAGDGDPGRPLGPMDSR